MPTCIVKRSSSQTWNGAGSPKGDSGKRGERHADGHDDSVTRRSRLFDERDRRQHAHPRQMRDSCGKHQKHQRPAAAKTVDCVTETEAQPIEYAAAIVA